MSELLKLLKTAIKEIEEDGFQPRVALVGPKFAEIALEELKSLGLEIYIVRELNCDAILGDPRFIGPLRKASRRISLEPLIEEKEFWEEIEEIKNL